MNNKMANKNTIEEIFSFHELVKKKTESEQMKLAQLIGIDFEEYKRCIKGKEKESEFILILKSLGRLAHFTAYDEKLSHITDEYTPEFTVELTDGYKMMIEVKHTDKEVYKISGGNLQKRIDFADRHELPLRFAISIRGIWGLFTTETLQAKNGKITIQDMKGTESTSWFDSELETCSYMFWDPIRIETIYSHNHKKGMRIYSEQHGELISFKLYSGKKQILKVKGRESNSRLYLIVLQALQDRLSIMSDPVIRKENGFTIITEVAKPPLWIFEYQFLLSAIEHTIIPENFGRKTYTADIVVTEENLFYLPVQVLRYTLLELVKLGMNISIFKNNDGFELSEYAKNYWGKSKTS